MAEARTVARPYAKAAFQAAVGADALSAWSSSLLTLATVVQQDKVRAMISSPEMTSAVKAENLLGLCAEELSDVQKNFVNVLADNKRLALLPDVQQLFDELKSERERSINVVVNSAFPLAGDTENKLASTLKETLQRDVSVETVIDESLVGGVLIKAGDVVIDGSIKGRLAKLAEAMNS